MNNTIRFFDQELERYDKPVGCHTRKVSSSQGPSRAHRKKNRSVTGMMDYQLNELQQIQDMISEKEVEINSLT